MDIDTINFNEKGLVPVITQDIETGDVLMFAWMNSVSLGKTLKTQHPCHLCGNDYQPADGGGRSKKGG